MRIFRYDQYTYPLPDGHRFPAGKYELLRRAVEEAGIVPPQNLIHPTPPTFEQLTLAHDPNYIERVLRGTLRAVVCRCCW